MADSWQVGSENAQWADRYEYQESQHPPQHGQPEICPSDPPKPHLGILAKTRRCCSTRWSSISRTDRAKGPVPLG